MVKSVALGIADDEQGLPVFHRLAVVGHDAADDAGPFGLHLVHDFHRFDNTEYVAFCHGLAQFDEGRFTGGAWAS